MNFYLFYLYLIIFEYDIYNILSYYLLYFIKIYGDVLNIKMKMLKDRIRYNYVVRWMEFGCRNFFFFVIYLVF